MAYDSQYNNGAPNGYGYQPGPAQTLEIKQREKRQIRKLGNISGLGILLFALFQFIGAGLSPSQGDNPVKTALTATPTKIMRSGFTPPRHDRL